MTAHIGITRPDSLSSLDIGNHYNQFAWAYRRYWGDHIHHGFFLTSKEDREQSQQAMVHYCAARAGLAAGMSVADVGCGHGGTASLLAKEYSCKVLGLTISETQLKFAQEACASLDGNVRFELANAEEYAFPSGSFDVIWNMESTEHFFDKPGYFGKVANALKPGGKLMVAAWSGSMKDQIIRDIARVFLCPELWTACEYQAQVEAAGLKVTLCEQLSSEVARTWDIAAERVEKSRWMLALLPAAFSQFTQGIELMREGYRSGQLTYLILVAERPCEE